MIFKEKGALFQFGKRHGLFEVERRRKHLKTGEDEKRPIRCCDIAANTNKVKKV
jgi:hypothetical protein